MTDNGNATQTIARFAAETPAGRIPDTVRHQAKRALLNFLATGVAGARDETFGTLLRSLPAWPAQGQATIVGRAERADALTAAFLNAAGGNVTDFDDTHLPTVIHPTAPIAPALYALSDLQRVRGADFIHAFVLGVEVACRIGNSISPTHYRRGWHITATCGVFGAAAAAGRLMGLDTRKMVFALGCAATQASGLVESLGQPTKSIGVGNAARNGLWSAQLAARGFEGPQRPLEGRFGFFNAIGETPKWPALLGGLGETWELAKNAYKPYPGGVVVHPVIDCVLDLRAKGVFETQDIARIVVHGHPLLSERADRPNVATGREAQVSVQHSAAVVQIFGKAGLDQYTDACVNDPAVLELRRKVEVVQDAKIPVESAMLELWTKDGRRHRVSVEAARGSAGRPLTDRELEQKFESLAGAHVRNSRRLIDAVWALDKAEDLSAIVAMTVPAR